MPPKKKQKLETFQDLKPLYLKELRTDYNYFIRAPKEVKNDRDCAILAVSKNAKLFKYASQELKKDLSFNRFN
jgi:CO dehydrogenase/acetyl-CoA synthase alpha subunit